MTHRPPPRLKVMWDLRTILDTIHDPAMKEALTRVTDHVELPPMDKLRQRVQVEDQ